MISFIVIGRNEEKNLRRCVESIYRGISASDINSYEIIYVDSRSTDRSIDIARQFPEVKIFRITGGCNAAVARNIGAKEASGDVLFFVDGDMEIYSEFLANAWNPNTHSIDEEIVFGQWLDITGSQNEKREMNKVCPGGTFLIKRLVWESVNGMRTAFKTGEEADLGLRLLQKGLRFRRKKDFIVNHYTVPYLHGSRVWKAVWDKSVFYARAVTYRHHFFNRHMYPLLLWRNDKTFILFVLSLLAFIIFPSAGPVLLLCYVLAVILRTARNEIYLPFVHMIGFYIISDVLNLIYFFTFYPKNIKEEYVEARSGFLQEVQHEPDTA